MLCLEESRVAAKRAFEFIWIAIIIWCFVCPMVLYDQTTGWVADHWKNPWRIEYTLGGVPKWRDFGGHPTLGEAMMNAVIRQRQSAHALWRVRHWRSRSSLLAIILV